MNVYIPDRIKIVAHGHKAEVFSLDEGHDPNETLPVARVSISWDELRPVSITVEYGTQLYRVGDSDRASPVSVDYPYNRVVMDVLTGGNRTGKE